MGKGPGAVVFGLQATLEWRHFQNPSTSWLSDGHQLPRDLPHVAQDENGSWAGGGQRPNAGIANRNEEDFYSVLSLWETMILNSL